MTDIIETIRSQFAHYLLLYSRSLRTKEKITSPPDTLHAVGFLSNLGRLPADDEDEATLMRDGLRVVYDTLEAVLDNDVSNGVMREQLMTISVIAPMAKHPIVASG